MATFQAAVERSLAATDAELESLMVSEDAMSLSYRVPAAGDAEQSARRVAAVGAAFLLAVRDGAGRPELTAQIYVGESSVPAASYCIDADWARGCVIGDLDHDEYLQRILDTLASREERAAGKVSFPEA